MTTSRSAPAIEAVPTIGRRTLESTDSDYVRRIRIACDDLHDEPFNPSARAAMLELLAGEPPAEGAGGPARRRRRRRQPN